MTIYEVTTGEVDGSRRAFVPFRAVDRPDRLVVQSFGNAIATENHIDFHPLASVTMRGPERVQRMSNNCFFFSVLYTKYQLSVLENAHTACTRHIYLCIYIYIYMYNIYICIWCIVLHLERAVI